MAMRKSLLAAVQGRSSWNLVPSPGGSRGSSPSRVLAGAVKGQAPRLLPDSSSTSALTRSVMGKSGLYTSLGIRYYRCPPRTGHDRCMSFWASKLRGQRRCTKEEIEALKKSFHYLDEKCKGGLARLEWYEKQSWLFWSFYGSVFISLLLGLHKELVALNNLEDEFNERKANKKTDDGVLPPAPPSPSSTVTDGTDASRDELKAESMAQERQVASNAPKEIGGTPSNPAAPGGA